MASSQSKDDDLNEADSERSAPMKWNKTPESLKIALNDSSSGDGVITYGI